MNGAPKRRGPRPSEALSESQRRAFLALRDFISEHRFPPTVKDLAQTLGMATASAHELVGQLVRKGYISRQAGKARGLAIERELSDAPHDLVSIPLVGVAVAGPPLLAEENRLGEVLVERAMAKQGRCFAVRVTGDSMEGAAMHDGDLAIVRQQPVAENGDIVVAIIDGEATIKRLSIRQHEIELRPENARYQPIPIGPDTEFQILGKVVAVRRLSTR
jgi:repressor LexA